MANSVYQWVLSVGDVIGKLLAFLTLPATLIAGYIYFDEVRDYFSKPDFETSIQRASLRCNYVWRDAAAYQRYQSGDATELERLCDGSPIAVSFEVSVTNNDAIARELRQLSVNATVSPYGILKLDEIQSVEHLIQHGVETNLRRDWRIETIPPGASIVFEILAFSSAINGDADHWIHLANRMDASDETLFNSQAIISFEAKVNGFFESFYALETCVVIIDKIEIDQWLKKLPHGRIQITNQCG